jgi:hypothetical protein
MQMDTVQRAHVDLRRKGYIIWSACRTVSGIWRMNGAFQQIATTAPAEQLAEAIDRALTQSRTGIPDTTRRGPLPFQPVLDALNLSSYGSYTRGTRSVAVERNHEIVSIIPYINNGPRNGFSAAMEKTIRLPQPSLQQLAEAVLRALALAS